MKTTLEIPDTGFRKAKARAAEQGIPLIDAEFGQIPGTPKYGWN